MTFNFVSASNAAQTIDANWGNADGKITEQEFSDALNKAFGPSLNKAQFEQMANYLGLSIVDADNIWEGAAKNTAGKIDSNFVASAFSNATGLHEWTADQFAIGIASLDSSGQINLSTPKFDAALKAGTLTSEERSAEIKVWKGEMAALNSMPRTAANSHALDTMQAALDARRNVLNTSSTTAVNARDAFTAGQITQIASNMKWDIEQIQSDLRAHGSHDADVVLTKSKSIVDEPIASNKDHAFQSVGANGVSGPLTVGSTALKNPSVVHRDYISSVLTQFYGGESNSSAGALAQLQNLAKKFSGDSTLKLHIDYLVEDLKSLNNLNV